MYQEKYNLNWHTYSDHLRDMLHDMMKSDELTDVTLVCDDKTTFKAHKVVLSACSSVFKSIISHIPQNNSVIYLRGIQHQEMESILEFMYLGVTNLDQQRKNYFLDVADTILFIGAIYKSEVYLSRYSDDYFHIIFQFVTNTLIITTVIITNFHLSFDSKHLLVT